ncbi:hypothetical protein CXF68_08835 [Tenacibaculum sp. Bg11-29]|uniref:hypothetical protein n=1 Tax=Tenacibaculum sp. Bg11-29 TaxID=2058306 RepID=UPI000C31CB69|nr:hypothetical protein [Tenacibaculum sp. Bg11-29]PKH50784.1 hypothetical protein CXF68_08835 [Tenacibaculum sp. Bg11-29]
MGGNAGMRGYIIQTIICLLDALEKDNDWISVTLEPLDESEKVDIRWKYPNSIIKLTQVKSSENTIGRAAAETYCNELTSHSPNASEYELSLIGPLAKNLLKVKSIANVRISKLGTLDTKILIDQASNKIDHYYTRKNKPKISPQVREIIVHNLNSRFATSSIIGTEITRADFDTELLKWISSIEVQIERNPFTSLAPPIENQNIPLNHRITKKILDLIGWNQFGENQTIEIFNEHTSDNDVHTVNFIGDFTNQLKEKTGDFVMVSSLHNFNYPNSSKSEITKYLKDVDVILADSKNKNEVPLKRFESTNYHSLLFWLTTDSDDLLTDFIHPTKDNYKRTLLNDKLTYYLIDNKRANFLISSIITAKNYRDDVSVKFLYPITEANQSPDKIGQRGLKLPVEYINSSVIPIAKEDKTKISFLLFCSDSFSPESLKKLIWLTIRLTSGFGNEYLLYFPDYNEDQHQNEALKTIRSFDEELLDDKIKVLRYNQVETEVLDSLPNTQTRISKNEIYQENNEESLSNSKHLNEAFINILPYGDILKPFLNTEAINANDLKIFLAKKGVFVKNADKVNLIKLMTTLLFSPNELEDFKSLIDVKEKTTNSINEHYTIKQNDSLENIFKKVNPNFDNITEGLNTKIVHSNSTLKFTQNAKDKEEFVLSLTTEIKDPTSFLLVNTKWGKIEIVVKKDNDRLVVVTQNTITREDKLIANRALKLLHQEFKQIDFVEETKIKVMFNSFKSNLERVNFLLSFTNISSSSIFKNPEILSITFKFDDDTEIPEKFKDKADKDLVIKFDGKNLTTLTELSIEEAKGSIFLEEIKIRYKFDYLNIQNGYYYVTYNFSKALRNKRELNGVFNSEPYLYKTDTVKKLSDIKGLERELSREIERFKIEKLKQFNIIE